MRLVKNIDDGEANARREAVRRGALVKAAKALTEVTTIVQEAVGEDAEGDDWECLSDVLRAHVSVRRLQHGISVRNRAPAPPPEPEKAEPDVKTESPVRSDGFIAHPIPGRHMLREGWLRELAEASADTLAVRENVREWRSYEGLLALHREAEALRMLSPEDEWKELFNRFRTAFVHRDELDMRKMVEEARRRPEHDYR